MSGIYSRQILLDPFEKHLNHPCLLIDIQVLLLQLNETIAAVIKPILHEFNFSREVFQIMNTPYINTRAFFYIFVDERRADKQHTVVIENSFSFLKLNKCVNQRFKFVQLERAAAPKFLKSLKTIIVLEGLNVSVKIVEIVFQDTILGFPFGSFLERDETFCIRENQKHIINRLDFCLHKTIDRANDSLHNLVQRLIEIKFVVFNQHFSSPF